MIPMSVGLGEGGDQVAPLGIAVIGGLSFSLISTLLFLPLIYDLAQGARKFESASLDPEDEASKYFTASQS
jgi:Cu/Ag efflux pump CusA